MADKISVDFYAFLASDRRLVKAVPRVNDKIVMRDPDSPISKGDYWVDSVEHMYISKHSSSINVYLKRMS